MTESGFARYPSLRDRAVVVTGGATGIGASIVTHFAEQGARVGFVDFDGDAGRALWLAADDSRLVTAQSFVVDGGWT